MIRAVLLSNLIILLTALIGCGESDNNYNAATPDETIDSAQQMIIDGRADRLVELVYADDDQMRSLLNQVGQLLGSVQGLASAVEQRFPEELASFRAHATEAAAQGKASPLLTRLVAAGRGNSRNLTFGASQIDREGLTIDTGTNEDNTRSTRPGMPRGPRSESERKLFNDIIKQLLADPFRWLAEGRDKLDTVYVTDDTVSMTWDGRPILPPFGLALIRREGRWLLVPPTSYPGVNRVMPRNDDEWFVWGSMIKTFDHVVTDLTTDVRNGRVKNMTDLADSAVEKAALPAMLVIFAYSNLMEERTKEAESAIDSGKATEDQP